MPDTIPSDIAEARAILRGQHATVDRLFDLAKKLKRRKAFHYAWQLLARARRELPASAKPEYRLRLAQQQALCLYKNPDLPAEERFTRALEILEKDCDLANTTNQETLGIAGAVYKYKWYWNGQRRDLERSLIHYQKGYESGKSLPAKDFDDGYTAINTAFVLDLLADLAAHDALDTNTVPHDAQERWKRASQIRKELVEDLPPRANLQDNRDKELAKQWWFLVTIAEAHFGLGEDHYPEAIARLQQAAKLPNVDDWEKESTIRQLSSLAQLQEGRAELENRALPNAWRVLQEGLDITELSAHAAVAGKVGLALSGGGFRASLYHIGVLAKLAELDLLRHVEVLSCVSGGSIVGAHYYLEVRKLLQEKADRAVNREDYIRIVRHLAEDFLNGVQTNIRTRVLTELTTNARIVFFPNYSHTERIADLFEKDLYSQCSAPEPAEAGNEGTKHLWFNKLQICPKGEAEHFDPRKHNWRRQAKAPILILNATTLNTGHNWQFTASYMGESPALIDPEVDGNPRYRRTYYGDAPQLYRDFPLGRAVAASACVPGMFTPVALPGLYGERAPGESLLLPRWLSTRLRVWLSKAKEPITVRLADGGVHDNQGAAGLLEQECALLLVSDASGQTAGQEDPEKGRLGVSMRANDVLMARVREAQYSDEKARRRSGLLRGLLFVHLRKDLPENPVDWLDCADPYAASEEARRQESRGLITSYGISKEIQRALSAIRTDLDSFSDKEAFALMTSGYRMVEHDVEVRRAQSEGNVPSMWGLPLSSLNAPTWPFLDLTTDMQQLPPPKDLMRILTMARQRGFKIWRLAPALRIGGPVLGVLMLILLGVAVAVWWSTPIISTPPTIGAAALFLLGLLLSVLLGSTVFRLVRVRESLAQWAFGLGASALGWLIGRIHLTFFDKWFLDYGKMRKRLTHEETMEWICRKGEWRRARKTKEMWARATTPEENNKDFHTAEGPVQRPQEGYWLCVGIVGEPWFQRKEKIESKYELVRTETKQFGFDDREHEYHVFKPKGNVVNQVVQVKGGGITFFAFRPTYDNQQVVLPAGAYVVTDDVADPRKDALKDVWVVQESIFENSYEFI